MHGFKAFALAAAASLTRALPTAEAGTREPEVFTENVLPHVWRGAPLLAPTLGAAHGQR